MGVAHHNEERLGPDDGHVEPLGVGEEAKPVFVVDQSEKRISIIDQSEKSMGIMDPSDACITTHLPPVGVDDPDVVLVHLEVQQLLDVVKLTRLTGGELCYTPHKNVVSDNSQCLEMYNAPGAGPLLPPQRGGES